MQAQAQFAALSKQLLPRLFQGFRPWGLSLILLVGSGGGAVDSSCSAGTTGVGRPSAPASRRCFPRLPAPCSRYIARRRSTRAYLALRQTLLEAGLGYPGVLEAAKAECQRLDATIIARHKAQIQEAEETHAAAVASIEQRKHETCNRPTAPIPSDWPIWSPGATGPLKEIEEKYPGPAPPDRRAVSDRVGATRARHAAAHRGKPAAIRARVGRNWPSAGGSGMERFRASVGEIGRVCRETFPDWNTDDWSRWTPPTAIPPVVRFGDSQIKLADDQGRSARRRAAAAAADSISRCRCCCPFRGVRCCC